METELEKLEQNQKRLPWALVQQQIILREVENALQSLRSVDSDIDMHEARYKRCISDCGLEVEAKQAEKHLNQ